MSFDENFWKEGTLDKLGKNWVESRVFKRVATYKRNPERLDYGEQPLVQPVSHHLCLVPFDVNDALVLDILRDLLEEWVRGRNCAESYEL